MLDVTTRHNGFIAQSPPEGARRPLRGHSRCSKQLRLQAGEAADLGWA